MEQPPIDQSEEFSDVTKAFNSTGEPMQGNESRVEELKSKHDFLVGIANAVGCTVEQIAQTPEEIDEDTKVYAGDLFPGIFGKNIEHIYSSFSEGPLLRHNVTVGGISKDILIDNPGDDIVIPGRTKDLLNSPDFQTLPSIENIDLIRLKVGDLGFKIGATTDEIYSRAFELGLNLCPADVIGAPVATPDYLTMVAMKQINDDKGQPRIFNLIESNNKSVVSTMAAETNRSWFPSAQFIFSLQKES